MKSAPSKLLEEIQKEYASYVEFNQLYKNGQSTFTHALDSVFDVIEAAASCCLNSSCAKVYNEMLKPTVGDKNKRGHSKSATQ